MRLLSERFGGSNALWRTSALKKSTFRRDVLTEDVELSTRLLVGRHKIVFCPEVRSLYGYVRLGLVPVRLDAVT